MADQWLTLDKAADVNWHLIVLPHPVVVLDMAQEYVNFRWGIDCQNLPCQARISVGLWTLRLKTIS